MFTDLGPLPDYRPPHDIEAEQCVLGALLINNRLIENVEDEMGPGDFFEPLHQQVYEAIQRGIKAGQSVSPITLRAEFAAHPDVDTGLTAVSYINRLITATTTQRHAIGTYARMVGDLAVRRGLIEVCQETIMSACVAASDEAVTPLIERHEAAVNQLTRATERADAAISFDKAIDQAIAIIQDAHQRNGALSGLPTGLARLDAVLGGLQKSDLIVLGGRPGSGKTALATNIASTVASGGYSVLFFSQEMSAAQLALRVVGDVAKVSADKLRRGTASLDAVTDAIRKASDIKDMPVVIDEAGGLSMHQLASRARRHKRKHDIDLIVIDYIQLMRGNDRKREQNRTQEVTEITIGLKALAKELQVPIVALSQLSRKVEERSDKRPQLSDLRESGSVEQDADVVMFVYREEYYVDQRRPASTQDPKFGEWQAEKAACKGKAEIIIGKNRHGETGTVATAFIAEQTRFENLQGN